MFGLALQLFQAINQYRHLLVNLCFSDFIFYWQLDLLQSQALDAGIDLLDLCFTLAGSEFRGGRDGLCGSFFLYALLLSNHAFHGWRSGCGQFIFYVSSLGKSLLVTSVNFIGNIIPNLLGFWILLVFYVFPQTIGMLRPVHPC